MEVLTTRKKRKILLALKKHFKKIHGIFLISGIVFSMFTITNGLQIAFIRKIQNAHAVENKFSSHKNVTKEQVLGVITSIKPKPTVTPTPKPTVIIRPTAIPTAIFSPTPTFTPTPQLLNPKQYTASKIGEDTWRVSNIPNDSTMATAQDIYNALNAYRVVHGVSQLLWNQPLADFAQVRANTFASSNGLDNHAGFKDFMNNNGFNKIGFNGLGENSAFLSGPMNGDRIIRNIFGADSAHDGNQLDPSWQFVGVGVNGNAVNVNFGKNKK